MIYDPPIDRLWEDSLPRGRALLRCFATTLHRLCRVPTLPDAYAYVSCSDESQWRYTVHVEAPNLRMRSVLAVGNSLEGDSRRWLNALQDERNFEFEAQFAPWTGNPFANVRELIRAAVGTRDAAIVEERFAVDGGSPGSWREIGRLFDLSGERVRQIVEKAIAKLGRQYSKHDSLTRPAVLVASYASLLNTVPRDPHVSQAIARDLPGCSHAVDRWIDILTEVYGEELVGRPSASPRDSVGIAAMSQQSPLPAVPQRTQDALARALATSQGRGTVPISGPSEVLTVLDALMVAASRNWASLQIEGIETNRVLFRVEQR